MRDDKNPTQLEYFFCIVVFVIPGVGLVMFGIGYF